MAADLLAEAADAIRAASPDLLAVTGDLVDYPLYGLSDPDLMVLGERDLQLVREILAPIDCPVAWLPGNHDHPDLFRRVFPDAGADIDTRGHRVLVFQDAEVEGHAPQRMGCQRERFLAALADSDPRPQIHLQHYLIAPEHNLGYPHAYREAASLRAALVADRRVRLVLSGHYHPGEPLFREAAVWFAVAPAFCEPPHRYRLFEVESDLVTQTERALRPPGDPSRPAVFLDRDGTINPQPAYRTGPGAFRLIEGSAQAMGRLRDAGFALVIVSNQTAVGHGWVTPETVGAVNDRMAALLAAEGVELDGVYCRYHSRDAVLPEYRTDSPETKPSPAMLRSAAADLNLDLARSFMIGDRRSDVESGRNAGCRGSILVTTGLGEQTLRKHGGCGADHVAPDLGAAADWILGRG